MTLTVLLKDERKYIFYGIREYGIRNEKEVHEGLFILDAIAGYYINR